MGLSRATRTVLKLTQEQTNQHNECHEENGDYVGDGEVHGEGVYFAPHRHQRDVREVARWLKNYKDR